MNIITAEQLKTILENDDPIVIDARGGADALERYNQAHLESAQFVDLETDLSEKADDPASGGRHPLPRPEDFGRFLGILGISPSSTVVVYDDKKGANAAARFWWMLKAAGHEKVYVVSGGLDAINAAGIQLTQKAATLHALEEYPVKGWHMPLVDADDVALAAADPDSMVIDVREHYRYLGESEPIDLVAGHIPGAVNIPYTSNLDNLGEFMSPADLAAKYKDAFADKDPRKVIVHCGSGVTACHTLLALAEAGLHGASLYVGSWSEWSRSERPIATGEA
ncbi:sulfurtransferase [Dyadobacter fermentans]|uniref:Rhodanese domain protein n=1 Tax=Dyadobacter fermentans (strain ATCC 700827 / DSM 18053 / CIP 107007 / KCTC 52180 / NS114) TaxID=471854 RepID=C6W588_DYAFD|nr:sulfurtransferase [Dyadobacter fermentans]ACT92448.1 Rhodanese domain protein [Dyadobacter fermentans DSM 18053]